MSIKFRDLRPDEIEVRVNQLFEKSKCCTLLLYKNARVDMDILDETVGANNWQRSHSRDNANCQVGIWDDDKNQWVWKEDTGTESNTEAEKGLASDSFKRACTNWGIGRKLYTRLNLIVGCDIEIDSKGKSRPAGSWEVDDIAYSDVRIIGIKIVHKNKKGVVDGVAVDTMPKSHSTPLITPKQKKMFDELGVKADGLLKKFHLRSIDELTEEQAEWVIERKMAAINEN